MGKSKYDKVFPTLKRVPVDDIDYQQKTDVVKQELASGAQPDPPGDDMLVHALIDECLDDIAEATKTICQTVVAAHKKRMHASVLGRYWLELRRIEDVMESQIKNVRLLLNAVEQLGMAQFEVEGADSMRFDELGNVYLKPEIVVKVRDRDALRDWYRDNGLYRELNPHHGAMQSLVKLRHLQSLEGQIEEDPNLPGVEAFYNTKFTK